MRNISQGLREQRAKQLKILITNYEKVLEMKKSIGDKKSQINLEALIKKAKEDLKDIK